MIERPLMTPDELKSMPKGQFVVMKTGAYPMRVRLKLFFEWGICFDEAHPYLLPENGNRVIHYATKEELQQAIMAKYPPKLPERQPKSAKPDAQGQPHTPRQNRAFPGVAEKRPVRTDSNLTETASAQPFPAEEAIEQALREINGKAMQEQPSKAPLPKTTQEAQHG